MLIHHSNLINLPRPLKICPMSSRTYTSNSTRNSFPVPCSTQLTKLKLYKLKRAPASLAALNSPICKDLLLLRVPHRSSADTVQYKSNGLWRSWQSRWAGRVDQDVRMRTKRRGWWWRGGHRGGHKGAQSTPPHCHSPRLDPTGLLCARTPRWERFTISSSLYCQTMPRLAVGFS